MSRIRTRAVPVVLWVGLAGLTALLHLFGAGVLGPPPLLHPHRVLAWWQERGPLLATFAAARELLCGIGAYLWLLWTGVGLASWASSAPLPDVLSRCRLPGARAGVGTLVGVSALGAALLGGATPTLAAPPASPPSGESATPVLRYAGPGGAPVLGDTGPGGAPVLGDTGPGGAPVLRDTGPTGPLAKARSGTPPTTRGARVPPPLAPPVTPLRPSPAPRVTPVRPSPAPRVTPVRPSPAPRVTPVPLPPHVTSIPPPPAAVRPADPAPAATWTVRRGDDLWSIAEVTLSRVWGVAPPEPDLARYWWQVVQANRPQLPNPSDPNLLFPGDVVAIPPPPPRPAGLQPR